jgi:nickel transport protein
MKKIWHRQMMKTVAVAAMTWMLLSLNAFEVRAHNVTVFAWVEGDTVSVESKFSGGRRPKNAPIEVYDSAGTLLLKGATDEQGKFSFTIPKKTPMKIVLLAGMGHRAEWIISQQDLAGHDRAGPESKRSGPDWLDVLGGLGCIFALVGLAAYIRSRRQKNPSSRTAVDGKPPADTNPSSRTDHIR